MHSGFSLVLLLLLLLSLEVSGLDAGGDAEKGARRRRRRRRTRENPGCISDAAIHPPVPCPLLIKFIQESFSHLDARP